MTQVRVEIPKIISIKFNFCPNFEVVWFSKYGLKGRLIININLVFTKIHIHIDLIHSDDHKMIFTFKVEGKVLHPYC